MKISCKISKFLERRWLRTYPGDPENALFLIKKFQKMKFFARKCEFFFKKSQKLLKNSQFCIKMIVFPKRILKNEHTLTLFWTPRGTQTPSPERPHTPGGPIVPMCMVMIKIFSVKVHELTRTRTRTEPEL